MIVTVSLRKESGAHDQNLSFAVAFGPLPDIKPLTGEVLEGKPTPAQYKAAVYAALKQVGDKALESGWIQ